MVQSFKLLLDPTITKAVVCTICGMVHIKDPLLLIEKRSPCHNVSFLSGYLWDPLPYKYK